MASTVARTQSDEDIHRAVSSELSWNPQIAADDIAGAVRDGVVTLSGFCHSFWEKGEAARAARQPVTDVARSGSWQ